MKKEQTQEYNIKIIPLWHTLVIFAIFLVIIISFLYLLDQKTSQGFGLEQMLFSIFAAWFIAFLLSWIRHYMTTDKYLAFVLGIFAILSITAGLFVRYTGPYTITFAVVGGLTAIIYLVIFFFKSKKEDD